MFTTLDWVVTAVIAISALLSVIRGFVREAGSIISWLAAFLLSGKFYGTLAPWLTFSADALTRNVLAMIIIFITALLGVGMLSSFICGQLSRAGLSGIDRLLGVAFGAARGVLIVCAVLALLRIGFRWHLLGFIQDSPWWTQSVLVPEMQRLVDWFFVYFGSMSTAVTGG